ncbi:hypothetical protein BDN72DRAFT_902586 [Pluteus cervinus]|uniref:Uncharacterized protein n=1 Tax=Pluteus cervinus TaxID=181527 RepID=A0ACD3ABI2_9AGAR|nr:hypothetical protein BDN72DRAFT_902586 [Pluteus cervinus]
MTRSSKERALFTSPPCPTADDIAIILGLIPGSSRFVTEKWTNESERMDCLMNCMDHIAGLSHYKAASILCEFGARYLPMVVDRFIAGNFDLYPPTSMLLPMFKLHNPYSYMLFRLCGRPYYVKYLRSKHSIATQGKVLFAVLTERLATAVRLCGPEMLRPGTRHRPSFHEPLTRMLRLLTATVAFTPGVRHQVDDDDVDILLEFTKPCKRTGVEPLGTLSEQLGMSLLGMPVFQRVAPGIRRDIQGRDKCGLPDCGNIVDLKACARCQTIYYVSHGFGVLEYQLTPYFVAAIVLPRTSKG